jgi:hypothetical protein
MSKVAAPPSAGGAGRGSAWPLVGAIALGLAAAAALVYPKAQTVWRDGAFFDSDDAMRAVQLRDLIAGQDWFDMTARRVDPPSGMFAHWSRIVDIPLAALTLLFRRLSPDADAERAMRLAFPALLLALLFFLSAWLARRLGAPRAALWAVAAVFLSGPMFLQFSPGRIDHHAPQIALLLLAAGFFFDALAPGRARAMFFCAAAMAVSLAISLENVPFFLPLLAALPLLFIVDGAKMRDALFCFALGAFIAFPLATAATIAPARYALAPCDAYGAAHLAAMLLGALGLAALALAAPRLGGWGSRLFACALAGLPAIVALWALAPQCLGDPLVGLDPLLRRLWLSQVGEVQPLAAVAAKTPNVAAGLAAPALLALLFCLVAVWRKNGVARRRAAVFAAMIAAGGLVAIGQVRVFTSLAPLAAVVLAIGLEAIVARCAWTLGPPARASALGLALIATSQMGVTLALPARAGEDDGAAKLACLTPQAFAALATLPPGRVLAPIDMGAHLLAHTPHAVFGAPYHRNNHGNRLVADGFAAAPDAAEALLRGAGADLVVWCANWKLRSVIGDAPGETLAGALAKGAVPPWLEEKKSEATSLHVFALRRNLY